MKKINNVFLKKKILIYGLGKSGISTYNFLKQIAWTDSLTHVTAIAHSHHEKMDGSGYPRAIKAEEIPIQSRMMTIADIYDALTAFDRP